MTLDCSGGVEKASPGVRIPSLGEVCWKIRLAERGIHDITLTTGGERLTMPIFGSGRLVPVFTMSKKPSFWEGVMNPGSPKIPGDVPIQSMQVKYPPMEFGFLGIRTSWLWAFLIISFAFGLCLKFLLKIE